MLRGGGSGRVQIRDFFYCTKRNENLSFTSHTLHLLKEKNVNSSGILTCRMEELKEDEKEGMREDDRRKWGRGGGEKGEQEEP